MEVVEQGVSTETKIIVCEKRDLWVVDWLEYWVPSLILVHVMSRAPLVLCINHRSVDLIQQLIESSIIIIITARSLDVKI